MKRVSKLFMAFTALGVMSVGVANGQKVSDILNAGVADANKLAGAYLKPYGEMLGTNLNAGWYNSADVHKKLGFDITLSATYSMAPSSMKSFDVNSLGLENFHVSPGSVSTSPTIAGKDKNRASLSPNVTGGDYVEFQLPDGSGVSGLATPMIQGAVGLPFHTEVMARFMPEMKLGDYGTTSLWGLGVKHSLKEYIPFLKSVPIWNVSVMGAYTNFGSQADVTYASSTGTLKVNSDAYTARLLLGANFPVICFYTGLGYGTSSSSFNVNGSFDDIPGTTGTTVNPVALAYDTSGFDFNVGSRLRLGIISFHADYTAGKYQSVTVGLGVNFR